MKQKMKNANFGYYSGIFFTVFVFFMLIVFIVSSFWITEFFNEREKARREKNNCGHLEGTCEHDYCLAELYHDAYYFEKYDLCKKKE